MLERTENDAVLPDWISYLLEQYLPQSSDQQQANELIQQLMQAVQNGDSCKVLTPTQIHCLAPIVQPETQAIQQPSPLVFDGQRLYLYRYWALEHALAQQVARLSHLTSPMSGAEYSQGLLTDPHQIQALNMVCQQSFNIITGGPGTGKTYTLARIIAVLNEAKPELRIAMAAPTGKAAQRMEEALQAAFKDPALKQFSVIHKNLKPVTLHRLLGLGTRAIPRFNARQRLPYDVIVVDEASMLDLSLAQMLFAAIPDHAKLILLGDAEQLASVDVGAVLANLQEVEALKAHRTHLQTSRRFVQGAAIGTFAQFIQQQEEEKNTVEVLAHFEQAVIAAGTLAQVALSSDMADHIQLQYLPDSNESASDWGTYYDQLMYGFQPYVHILKQAPENDDEFAAWLTQVIKKFDDYRILSAIRYGKLGLHELNQQIESRVLHQLGALKQGDWYVGRPVMMTYNDYQLGLSNGDIGICLIRPSQPKSQFEVYFPSLDKWVAATRLPKSIETAYALTIHKSQGSEFTHTAVVLENHAADMMSKELIYTAITRAKKVVSLLVAKEALAKALTKRTARVSGLLDKVNNQLAL
ncbi:exodeoxyribonuclease V subunit alpha [Acinetobacter sp. ANC 5054]|uniref:exodeoxyribonuclease V subunit alpha n=1 Tax=Acinetobacter sp. ANC 5054 TaxID=1977877 RepID=UPI000A348751|nr:exodeoxyribonuclease V subunit alpha [Acinetobacter sp. ANC 5054]OTG84366.1 exodeoxyribonuclease V subunit alpha [Acinetobacter sp. ANC 5054]